MAEIKFSELEEFSIPFEDIIALISEVCSGYYYVLNDSDEETNRDEIMKRSLGCALNHLPWKEREKMLENYKYYFEAIFDKDLFFGKIKIRKDKYYLLDYSSIFTNDWHLLEVNKDFLNNNFVINPSNILIEEFGYSEEELSGLICLEKLRGEED